MEITSTDGICLRPASLADASTIRDMVHAERLNPMSLNWEHFILAVDQAGKAIGCGQIKPHKDGTFELASIVVLPEWRGKGVARRIIEQLLEIHPGRLYLTCRSNLESLYQRFGFRTIQEEEMTSYFRRLNRIAHFISRIFHLPFSLLVMKRN